MYVPMTINPTDALDVRWDAYVASRVNDAEAHLVGGIPDYAFALDCSLRQKLSAMPGFRKLMQVMTSTYVPRTKQEKMMQCLKVGPTQMPEVYAMTRDCARRLGIGMPDVFIERDFSMNAYTIATDDDSPIVVITTGMLERATPGELKACIGHECGHVHNAHSIYTAMANLFLEGAAITIPGVSQALSLLSTPIALALKAWDRASEVTADRAGIICSDDWHDTLTLQAKLMSGGAIGAGNDFDIDAIVRQYDAVREAPTRVYELMDTHPSGVRRIIAAQEFLRSDVLLSWRPEWREPGMKTLTKDALDARCKDVVGVVNNKKRKGGR